MAILHTKVVYNSYIWQDALELFRNVSVGSIFKPHSLKLLLYFCVSCAVSDCAGDAVCLYPFSAFNFALTDASMAACMSWTCFCYF